jgi:hypothetical protein
VRRVLATVDVLALAGTAAAALAPSVGGQATGSQEFSFTTPGADQPFVVPADVCAVTIRAAGAGGGGEAEGASGGSGGLAVATLPVTPGQTLTVRVGEAGGDGPPFGQGPEPGGAGGAPGGGDGGSGDFPAGGGGGFSDVRSGSVVLALGAGGGGAEDGLGGGGGGGSSYADPTGAGVSLLTGEGAGAGEDGSVLIEWTAGTGACAVEAVIRFTG